MGSPGPSRGRSTTIRSPQGLAMISPKHQSQYYFSHPSTCSTASVSLQRQYPYVPARSSSIPNQ
ncbi:hypothetical protein GUJ93_ZPchr0012g21020 [Zizania palustris]|uniref:Uncharacterized protein n=1 Tax=Zizania palustris TaxID=103762 RepID=A0A8J5WNT7_ZIZPA|nr:hypothetical protein GUJ93_ZPchr0012g21020 [Zizania palustris]